jgi:F-type H+-transporting ATPase subunit gamma
MSGTTEQLRRRISGAENLEGVVRSMKAIAASSISQYERAVESLQDYYRAVELGLAVCLRESGPITPGFRPVQRKRIKIGAIVFGSDQGLVGRFNEVVTDFASHSLGALAGTVTQLWTVGERAHALMSGLREEEPTGFAVPSSVNAITALVGKLLVEIETALEQGIITEVHLFHNHPLARAQYEPVSVRLLPLDQTWQRKVAKIPWPTRVPPEVIQGTLPALQAFIRGYLFVLLFQACAESLASENACRLAAMQRAEKNIGDIVEELSRTYHRIRQESIDEELFDVIAGYEAEQKPV